MGEKSNVCSHNGTGGVSYSERGCPISYGETLTTTLYNSALRGKNLKGAERRNVIGHKSAAQQQIFFEMSRGWRRQSLCYPCKGTARKLFWNCLINCLHFLQTIHLFLRSCFKMLSLWRMSFSSPIMIITNKQNIEELAAFPGSSRLWRVTIMGKITDECRNVKRGALGMLV